MRYKDLFKYYTLPRLSNALDDWDNLSEGNWDLLGTNERKLESSPEANQSPDACRAFCEAQEDCLQFSWRPEKCFASRVFTMGHHTTASAGKVCSGWIVDRIEAIETEMEPCPPMEESWIT